MDFRVNDAMDCQVLESFSLLLLLFRESSSSVYSTTHAQMIVIIPVQLLMFRVLLDLWKQHDDE